MTIYEIKVYFDAICAWSYIGHRTLFQAIDLFRRTYPNAKHDEFVISWLPFYRDRNLPLKGVPLEERLVSALGSDRTDIEKARVQRLGKAYGINFTLQGRVGHTRDCHRLMYFAGKQGGAELQKVLIEQIYQQWFEVGGDITSHDFLKDCAGAVGMSEGPVVSLLESAQFADEVDNLDARAREEQVSSVPTYIINKFRIEGASDVETFYELFTGAKETHGND